MLSPLPRECRLLGSLSETRCRHLPRQSATRFKTEALTYPLFRIDASSKYSWPPQPPSRYQYYNPTADSEDDDSPGRPPLDPREAFTYGEDLNPDLIGVHIRSQHQSAGNDSDDDQPLARRFRGRNRIRRGSEGYEVRHQTMAERMRSIGLDMPAVEACEQRLHSEEAYPEGYPEQQFDSESEWEMDSFEHDGQGGYEEQHRQQ